MQSKFVAGEHGLTLVIPPDLAERYHLAPDVEVEITATDDGIMLEPLGVEPWFSIEWERALEAVLEDHREALELAND
jgi:bifunctional DNA-binding transcriptional regulator/antitoxin component of YhaV-PrlF toxin-antitoxin module